MGWRFHLPFVGEVKTKSPDEMIRDGAKNTLNNIGMIAEGIAKGEIDKIRAGAGGLVLDNNMATIGARKAAQELFPQIPDAKFSEVIGSGVVTFLATGNVYLTVISVAKEFYAEYELAGAPPAPGPTTAGGGAPMGARAVKTFKVSCQQMYTWDNPNGGMEIWAGFSRAPRFKLEDGTWDTWPNVDIRPGDTVELKAKRNEFPNRDIKDGQTVLIATGKYKRPAPDTPGVGQNQITQNLVLEYVSHN